MIPNSNYDDDDDEINARCNKRPMFRNELTIEKPAKILQKWTNLYSLKMQFIVPMHKIYLMVVHEKSVYVK